MRRGVTIEWTREFINEGPYKSSAPRFNEELSVSVDRLAILVLVRRRHEDRDAPVKILPGDASECLAVRFEAPVRIDRPDNLASLVIEYLNGTMNSHWIDERRYRRRNSIDSPDSSLTS